jgi:hypothetical protein
MNTIDFREINLGGKSSDIFVLTTPAVPGFAIRLADIG